MSRRNIPHEIITDILLPYPEGLSVNLIFARFLAKRAAERPAIYAILSKMVKEQKLARLDARNCPQCGHQENCYALSRRTRIECEL